MEHGCIERVILRFYKDLQRLCIKMRNLYYWFSLKIDPNNRNVAARIVKSDGTTSYVTGKILYRIFSVFQKLVFISNSSGKKL